MSRKPILCLDFDGVIHGYQSGWQGADCCPDPITPGTVEFIVRALEYFTVSIFSSRSNQPMGIEAMRFYLKLNFYRAMEAGDADPLLAQIEWPREKPPALLTIDDRALTFTGDWSDFPLDKLRAFQPWNKRSGETPVGECRGIPEGWVLVLAEPNGAMRSAGKGYHPMADVIYAAMLAASPTPPAAEPTLTDAMLDAGARAHDHWSGDGTVGAGNARRNVRQIWDAMAAAEPTRG